VKSSSTGNAERVPPWRDRRPAKYTGQRRSRRLQGPEPLRRFPPTREDSRRRVTAFLAPPASALGGREAAREIALLPYVESADGTGDLLADARTREPAAVDVAPVPAQLLVRASCPACTLVRSRSSAPHGGRRAAAKWRRREAEAACSLSNRVTIHERAARRHLLSVGSRSSMLRMPDAHRKTQSQLDNPLRELGTFMSRSTGPRAAVRHHLRGEMIKGRVRADGSSAPTWRSPRHLADAC